LKGRLDVKPLQGEAGKLARIPSSRKGKWIVVVLWVVVMAFLSPLAGNLSKVQNNQASSWLPGNAESTKVLQISERFRSSEEVPAVIVYERSGGLTSADLNTIRSQIHQFGGLKRVNGKVEGPILPTNEAKPEAAQVVVPMHLLAGNEGWNELPGIVDKMRTIAHDGTDGMTVHVTGPAGLSADQAGAFSGTDGVLLLAAILVVLLILLMTYRSPILWLLPLLSVGFSLMAAQGIIYVLAKNAGLTVNGQSAGILMVLVFGVGTDYALLLIARYREELRVNQDRHKAMAIALRRAGPSIWASAATVIIGMLCLSFADLNSTAGLGPVAAIGVGVALLAMTTVLPALLVICGRWVFWPSKPAFGSVDKTERGVWARIGTRIARRPRFTWVGIALVLGVLAMGTLGLKADGLTNAAGFTGSPPDSIVGADVLAKHFPGGANQPIQVVASADKAADVEAALNNVPGISVANPVVKDGYVYLEGTTKAEPDSPSAVNTLTKVRDAIHRVPGANAMAGGTTALQYDTVQANKHDRAVILPIIIVVVLLILMLLLRSIVAPVLLLGTVVLSFFAAMGISSFFFNNVFGFHGADASFPLSVFVYLVALGVDYNIFLMTRVQEEARTLGTRRGALIGLKATGGVITSAGLVLAGTFAVLGTLPLTFFAELGFAVAIGVLIDTFVIRSLLVTGLTLDVGRFMWWPNKLANKRDVDVDDVTSPEPPLVLASDR
jgi:RND superfamily putative drug exporter